MKVLLISESRESPSTRYRLSPLARDLRGAGHQVSECSFDDREGRSALFKRSRECDVVVLQRRLVNRLDFWRLKSSSRRLILDFDDAISYRDQVPFESRTRSTRFTRACRSVHMVVAGNDYLRELALKAGAKAATTIPTCLDPYSIPNLRDSHEGMMRSAFRENSPVIVWIGGKATRRYLEALVPVFREVAPEGGNVLVRVIGDARPHWKGIHYEFVPWSPGVEWSALQRSTVGVSPLPSDPWTRGKCGLKVLQYSAACLPSVVSPVGVQTEIIRDAVSGFHAQNLEEWVESLEWILNHHRLAREMGEHARDSVWKSYSWTGWSDVWLNMLASINQKVG